MLLNFFLITSSLLLGSTVSRIVANILVFQKGLNLFPSGAIQSIQLFSQQFAERKTYDLVEFLLFVAISITIFGLLSLAFKKKELQLSTSILIGSVFLVFAFVVNVSTLFAGYSGTQTLILIGLWCLATLWIAMKVPPKLGSWQDNKFALANGVFVGFFLSILLHKFTASVAMPLSFFALTPLYFYLFAPKYSLLKNILWPVLLVGAIFPYNKFALLILGVLVLFVMLVTNGKIPSALSRFVEKLYPILILIIFLYNPMFYYGSFDSVEEGFWAGWLQRMNEGLTMYRDFAIYHPPLLPGGLYVFGKLFGESLYNMRLYFHILQIAGSVIFYLILSKLVKSNWIRIFIFALILAYSSSLVRNNMEIRVGSGLLPLLFVYFYKLKEQRKFLFIAGIISGLALFISVETGIASIIAVLVAVLISGTRNNFLKNVAFSAAGIALPVILIFAVLFANHSINSFFEYVIFYARNFSLGYQNVVLDRPEPSTLIQWMDVNSFVGNSGFLWEMTRAILLGSAAFAFLLKIKGTFKAKDILFGGIAVFGLILCRSALARSDYYHVVFIWIAALLLLGYILEFISQYSKIIPAVIFTLLIFFVGRDVTQTSFIQNQLIKFQSYGNPVGSYPSYKNPKEGILVNIDINTKETDEMIAYIDNNVSKEEYIYVFPHAPEIYFLSDRKNASSFDSPTIFFTPKYQKQTIEELKRNKPRLIIYNPGFAIAGISVKTLGEINNYIIENFVIVAKFGDNQIMQPKENI